MNDSVLLKLEKLKAKNQKYIDKLEYIIDKRMRQKNKTEESMISKYIDKIEYIIAKRMGQKNKTEGSSIFSRSNSNRGQSTMFPDNWNISNADDSGIIMGKEIIPQQHPNSVIITEAIVEPQQPLGLWSSTPKDKLKKSFEYCDAITLNNNEEQCKTLIDSEKISVEIAEQTEPNVERREEFDTEVITSTDAEEPNEYCLPLCDEHFESETSKVIFRKKPILDRSFSDLSRWRNSMQLNLENDTFERPVDDKFVINLFESRQSNRWKRKSIRVYNFNRSITIIDKSTNEGGPEMAGGCKKDDSEFDEMFYKLKKMRDVECVKMKEASNALRLIKEKRDRDWSEELVTEKILLETDLKYKIIVNKIRDLKYSGWRYTEHKHSATITISEFEFEVTDKLPNDNKFTEFFILALSHETEVFTTKVVAASGEKLVFNEKFTFKNLSEQFSIKAEVFSIKLKTARSTMIKAVLKKKSHNLCPIFRIYYENINTLEVQESAVLRSSFTSCGAFVITKENIAGNAGNITQWPCDSRLKDNVNFTMDVDLKLSSKLSGFLTMGKADEHNNVVSWERKWCSLNGSLFSVYNYPQEEEFAKSPQSSINLKYCFVPLIRPENFPKKNAFILKTGRPSIINENNNAKLRIKDNFVLEKNYLFADSKDDFRKWTDELDMVLSSMEKWDKLIFVNEYC